MKSVSILVPLYGAELYIEQCAHSLLSQSYPHCEFIFVDDASRDNSLALLKATVEGYELLRECVKIIELEENGGVAAARNVALDAAKGDYILFVDADDWVDPTLIEKLIAKAEESDAQICNAWCMSVDNDNIQTPTPSKWIGGHRTHLKAVLGQSHIVPNHLRGMLIDRFMINHNSLRFTPRVDFGEDYSLLPQLLYYATRLATLPEYLYFYRTENDGSYMNNIGERHIKSYVAAQKIVSDFIYSQPDTVYYKRALILGRINIKKWIFKRGVDPKSFDSELFGSSTPYIKYLRLRRYNSVVDQGNPRLIKLYSIMINFSLYIRSIFANL